MNDIIKKRELAMYGADLARCEQMIADNSEIKYFDIICCYKDGSVKYLTDNFINFPFSVENEVKVLLNDAIAFYKELINQIENK